MSSIPRNRPLSWILWHPHQGLWNARLLRTVKKVIPIRPIYRLVSRAIILIDTILLFTRALNRRISKMGIAQVFSRTKVPPGLSLLYFDLGTHKEARELSWMVEKVLPRLCDHFEAYGFEAARECFEQAKAKFVGRENVRLIHRALCYELPADGVVKLYKDSGAGLGNSLYRSFYAAYEEAPAVRLSGWLRENNLHPESSICLLRINIEGAEYDVIMDLVENGLARQIDGYYGMWDDISKIDQQRDEMFRAFLAKHRIFPFAFNGRDFTAVLRMKCIEYDIKTQVQAGIRRIKKLASGA